MRSGWLLRDGDVVCALEMTDSAAERGALRRRRGLRGGPAPRGCAHRAHGGHEVPRRRGLPVGRSHRGPRWRGSSPGAWPRGGRAARSVVETEAGALERWGVRVGDQLEVREVRQRREPGRDAAAAGPAGPGGHADREPGRPLARGPSEVLAAADLICCEDTRRTRALLSAVGIPAGGPDGDRLLSLHGHNEASRARPSGRRPSPAAATVALVSDAGTPGISDPGAWSWPRGWPRRARRVTTVPGPSAVLGALVVSGLPTDRFCVEGFLPRKGAERRRRIAALMADERTAVVLEAPGRVAATLAELAATDPARPVAVVRELTKLHEEVWRGTLAEAAAVFAARRAARRGGARGGWRAAGRPGGRRTTSRRPCGGARATTPTAGPAAGGRPGRGVARCAAAARPTRRRCACG